ncbi:MAG: hypothetical protein FWG87_01695 [Defluviitaleaceae bacterium]|nr:hypothetical protein [Defluviitaleaceae bacterium]
MKQERKMKPAKGFNIFLSIVLAAVLIFLLQTAVFAASPNNVLTVDTSLNIEIAEPNNEQASLSKTPEWVWHPISVVNEPMNGFNAIRRTYALPPDVNPAVIPTADFDMLGQQFTLAYVLQQPTSDEAFIEMRETVTIETRSNNLNDILPNLEQEIWYERDGFAGTLMLDLHSINSAVTGTSRHTTTATRQRAYPHLSSADNSLIPRTITDNGTDFHLSSVEWQPQSVSAVDGQPLAFGYTAHATYTAQVTQTRNTGHTVAADYTGTVFRTTEGKTLFTAVFYGEPIIEVWLEELAGESIANEAHEAGSTVLTIPHAYQSGLSQENELALTSLNERKESHGLGSDVIIAIAVIGTLLALAAVGVGGFLSARHLLGYNATVYSINGPREIVKAGKIKLDLHSPEPIIILDKAIGNKTAKTDRYIIQLAQRAAAKLINKDLRVVLCGKEAIHKVTENALGMSLYEFEVNFSDEDGELPYFGAAAE